jgi:hypothetical protein
LLAEDIRRQREAAGGAPSDRDTAQLARSAPVREFVDAVWPAVDPAAVVFGLLTDAGALASAARGLLTDAEQRTLRWPDPPRSVRAARWTAADAVLVDEVAGLLARPDTYGHVVLDEAQDLSGMQCRAVARRCPTGSITLLGDLAQGTTPWATPDWASTLAHLGKPDARVEPLTRGYRVPAEAIAYANRLLPLLAAGLTPATSIRTADGGLRVRHVAVGLGTAVVEEARAALRREGSIGLIAADAAVPALDAALTAAGVEHAVLGAAEESDEDEYAEPDARISLVPATLVKGLEFDHVVVIEPDGIVRAEPRGLRRLYVALTRAVSRLVVLHADPLPERLAA